jgi:hypothetical protein
LVVLAHTGIGPSIEQTGTVFNDSVALHVVLQFLESVTVHVNVPAAFLMMLLVVSPVSQEKL